MRLEQRVPVDHPLRAIRELSDAAVKEPATDFNKLYSREGVDSAGALVPGAAPAGLLHRAFGAALMEQLDYVVDPVWDVFRKGAGKEAKLCHMGHLMTKNRNGLIVDARVTETNGTAERDTALDKIDDNAGPGSTAGAEKNYDTADFVAGCRERGCTPHASRKRRSAIDARTTRNPGYRIGTIKRKRIEEPFGWMKTVGGLRNTRHCGRALIERFSVLTATAYNLIHISHASRNRMSLSGMTKSRQIGTKPGVPRLDCCRSVLSAAWHPWSKQATQTFSATCS